MAWHEICLFYQVRFQFFVYPLVIDQYCKINIPGSFSRGLIVYSNHPYISCHGTYKVVVDAKKSSAFPIASSISAI